MNVEQLKLILEHLSGLGAEAKGAFIWWLVMEHVPQMLVFLAFFAFAAWAIKHVFRRTSKDGYDRLSRVNRAYEDLRHFWLYDAKGGYESGGEKSKASDAYKAVESLKKHLDSLSGG